MICDNCGMEHRPGENKLCNGPFISQAKHRKIVGVVGQQFFLMRNQYMHRMRMLDVKVPAEDQEVIIGCLAEVQRNT